MKEIRDGATMAALGAGSWRGKERREIRSSGYVVHTLEAALWWIDRSDEFAQAVLLAPNLGEDADTIAAVTGQVAGALCGLAGIPRAWLDGLAWRERLENTAGLFDRCSIASSG